GPSRRPPLRSAGADPWPERTHRLAGPCVHGSDAQPVSAVRCRTRRRDQLSRARSQWRQGINVQCRRLRSRALGQTHAQRSARDERAGAEMKCHPLPSRLATAMLALLWGAGSAAAPAEEAARARTNFIHHCTGCHLADGSGAPSKGIPSMRNTLSQFLKVTGGREFIVQVPGVMNSSLNDHDIAGLMNWLLPYVSPGVVPPDMPP